MARNSAETPGPPALVLAGRRSSSTNRRSTGHSSHRDHASSRNGEAPPFIVVDPGSAVDPVHPHTPDPPLSPDPPPNIRPLIHQTDKRETRRLSSADGRPGYLAGALRPRQLRGGPKARRENGPHGNVRTSGCAARDSNPEPAD